jgi:hypothetical protein
VQARPDKKIVEQRQWVVSESGCHTISIADVYDGYGQKDLQIADWDWHPNALGHELIAERMFSEFMANPQLLSKTDALDEHIEISQGDSQWDRSDKR